MVGLLEVPRIPKAARAISKPVPNSPLSVKFSAEKHSDHRRVFV